MLRILLAYRSTSTRETPEVLYAGHIGKELRDILDCAASEFIRFTIIESPVEHRAKRQGEPSFETAIPPRNFFEAGKVIDLLRAQIHDIEKQDGVSHSEKIDALKIDLAMALGKIETLEKSLAHAEALSVERAAADATNRILERVSSPPSIPSTPEQTQSLPLEGQPAEAKDPTPGKPADEAPAKKQYVLKDTTAADESASAPRLKPAKKSHDPKNP